LFVERTGVFTLTFYTFCILTLPLKLEKTIFVILCNCSLDETIPDPIHQLRVACGVRSARNRATYVKSKEKC